MFELEEFKCLTDFNLKNKSLKNITSLIIRMIAYYCLTEFKIFKSSEIFKFLTGLKIFELFILNSKNYSRTMDS